jgi:murein DD-endopeptidase MepM/ murein hydrolase activator NlpD
MKSGILILILYIFSILPLFSANGEPKTGAKAIAKEKTDNPDEPKKKTGEENAEGGEDEEEDDENEVAADSLFVRKLSSIIWDINDSVRKIPAYDVYCDWNNYVIHPYKFNLSGRKDTTHVKLLDEHHCEYSHPVEGYITSPFGPRKGRFHYGIDLKLEVGDSVYNAFDGVVRIARISPTYGNVVVVRHKNGLETLYAHLEKIAVEVGNEIFAGDLIGLGGNTGRSTGSHLHFEVRYMGEAINPAEIICFENYILKKDLLVLQPSLFSPSIQARATKYYTVRSGDTLGKIAKKHRTTVSTLCKLNKIKPTTVIRPGMKLKYV